MTNHREPLHGAPSISAIDDREILARLARGELGALAMLYERYQGVVFRFVSHATGEAADAEDLVQSTFLVAAKTAKSFDGRSSARPWLFGIASRLVRRRLRSRARWLRAFDELTRRLRGTYHDGPREVSLRNEVARALGRLSERKRVVILLAEVEGMTCEEIAEVLNVPIGTVWTRMHHARRELRALLRERQEQ